MIEVHVFDITVLQSPCDVRRDIEQVITAVTWLTRIHKYRIGNGQ